MRIMKKTITNNKFLAAKKRFCKRAGKGIETDIPDHLEPEINIYS
jgi:hypothetical protein